VAGYSLGGNFALRLALRAPAAGLPLARVAAVCPVLDPARTMLQMENGLQFYMRYFERKWRGSLVRKRALFPDRHDFDDTTLRLGMRELTEWLVQRHTDLGTIDNYFDGYSVAGDRLSRLRVPADILMAADDPVIPIDEFRALALPPHIAPFIAPAGAPQTKPRAINAAIPFVTGTFLVVYDAEDRPEPGQLRAAVARFADVPDTVACLQARLVIDNSADSWLTRFFTIEYAALFDVVKAGTARLGLPVPLGGTSNHFRADALRAIGLWDAWNVTEDADLGFRLAIHGFGVEDLNAATYEEAPNRLGPWLHQRSRWLKGWMQTIISHSRRPVAVWRAMGTVNFLSAVAQSAGVIVGALGAPVFHTLVVLRVMAPEPFGSGGLVLQMADALIVVLGIAGILSVYVPAFMALHRRRLWPLAGWALALPLYQLLVSVAAYKAAWELVRAPHRWNKTTHGTARRRQTPMA